MDNQMDSVVNLMTSQTGSDVNQSTLSGSDVNQSTLSGSDVNQSTNVKYEVLTPKRNTKLEHYTYFYESGKKKREEFYLNGNLHSNITHFNTVDDQVTEDETVCFDDSDDERRYGSGSNLELYKKDITKVQDYPAVINYKDDDTNEETTVEYWQHGNRVPTREVEWNNYEQEIKEFWHIDGVLHRDGAPAYLEYYDPYSVEENGEDADPKLTPYAGELIKEEWRQHGKFYRKNGPAYVEYNYKGQVQKEVFYDVNGMPVLTHS